jgi:phosphomevalonate kinase
MISGEYVVLDGLEALVASVDRRLTAVGRPGSAPSSDGSPGPGAGSPDGAGLPPEALLARQHAEEALGEVPMELTVDASALRRDGRKLGLGSSAAASAAAAGAVVAWHGRDPADERRRILDWALAGHRAVAPQGSGADVAAATLGGVVRFRRAAARDAEVIRWPAELRVEVVWTGEPARTSDLLSKVRGLAERSPEDYRDATAPLREAAEALLGAVVDGDVSSAVRAAGDHGRAMQHLGERTDAEIVTEPLARVAQLAEAHGGAAKPSGAGGGDVALAFFADADDADRFRRACPDAGLTLVSLAMGAEGVRLDEAPVPERDR